MGAKMLLHILILYSILIVGHQKKQATKQIFRVMKFEECPGKFYREKHITIKYITNQIISVDKEILNSAIELKSIPPRPQLVATAVKCEAMDYASCVELWSFRFDLCSKLQNSIFYSKTASTLFHPALKCPIKDGVYKSINYTANQEDLLHFLRSSGLTSITDYFVGVRLIVMNDRTKQFGCLDARGKFYHVKSMDNQKA